MSGAFIDSNIFIAFANKRDRDHARAEKLMNDIRIGEFGRPYSSDYIFDEAITTAFLRTRRLEVAVKVGKIILGSIEESIPPLARMVYVDDRIFMEAWATFRAGRFKGLSFTDHTILAQMTELGIDVLISFDSGFDGLVARIS